MPWKLYIDSRKRVAGASGDTDTAFTVQLPRPITVSGKAYIDVVLCPNSWYLIRAGETNRLYISETQNDVKRVVFLAPGQYQSVHDLTTACQFALNQNKGIPGTYVCQYKKELNRMCIGITGSTTSNDNTGMGGPGCRGGHHFLGGCVQFRWSQRHGPAVRE